MTMQGGLSPARSTGTRLARTTMPVASRSAASKDCAALNPGPKIRHSQRVLIRGIHASSVRLFLRVIYSGGQHANSPRTSPLIKFAELAILTPRADSRASCIDAQETTIMRAQRIWSLALRLRIDRPITSDCHCARERVRCQGTRLWIRGSSGPSRRQQRGSAAPPRRQSFTARVQQRRRCSAGPCVTAWNTPSTSAPLTRNVT